MRARFMAAVIAAAFASLTASGTADAMTLTAPAGAAKAVGEADPVARAAWICVPGGCWWRYNYPFHGPYHYPYGQPWVWWRPGW